MRLLQKLFGIVIFCLATACATNTKVNVANNVYKTENTNCTIQFYKNIKPEISYESLAKIESHIQRNFFFGGKARLEDEAYTELRAKACQIGGDGVILDDYVESSASEFSHVYVWATVIRSTNK